jgi:glycosyltransferase involved in cell wall biosynthesis
MTASPKLFSVVIPFYDGSEGLEKSVLSAALQRFPLGDFEVILAADSISQELRDRAQLLTKTHQNVKLFENSLKSGAGAARNLGLDSSTGRYVVFLDSDDELMPGALRKLGDQLDRFGQTVDVIFYSAYERMAHNPAITFPSFFFREQLLGEFELRSEGVSESLDTPELFSFSTPAPWLRAIRRDLLLGHQIRFQEIVAINDLSFYVATLSIAKSALFLNRRLVIYTRDSPASLSMRHKGEPQFLISALQEAASEQKRLGASTERLRAFRKFAIQQVLNRARYLDGGGQAILRHKLGLAGENLLELKFVDSIKAAGLAVSSAYLLFSLGMSVQRLDMLHSRLQRFRKGLR